MEASARRSPLLPTIGFVDGHDNIDALDNNGEFRRDISMSDV